MSSAVKRKQTNVSMEKKPKAIKKLDKGEIVSKVTMESGKKYNWGLEKE